MWIQSPLEFRLRPDNDSVADIINEWFVSDPNGYGLMLACHILWQIWKSRNDYIFKNLNPNPSSVNINAIRLSQEYENHDDWEEVIYDSVNEERGSNKGWNTLPPDYYKINVDGAFINLTYDSAWSAVARDEYGQYRGCRSCFGRSYSPLEAEVKSFQLGLQLANDLGFKKVILEGDSLTAVHLIKGDINDFPWKIRGLLFDIQNQLHTFEDVKVTFSSRDTNEAAHDLAKFSLSNKISDAWTTYVPPCITSALHSDSLCN